MNKDKILLFAGIVLLGFAIILRLLGISVTVFYSLLLAGIILKIIYLAIGLKSGKIIIGISLYFLFSGVILALISILLKYYTHYYTLSRIILITGISFKILFVVLTLKNWLKVKY